MTSTNQPKQSVEILNQFTNGRPYKMRDIYNREKKLETWTEKIKTELEEYDKADTFGNIGRVF
jgi:hypothetical protein